MTNKDIIVSKRKQALLYQLDKFECCECPLEKHCRLNDAVYEESICTALKKDGQAESEDKLDGRTKK